MGILDAVIVGTVVLAAVLWLVRHFARAQRDGACTSGCGSCDGAKVEVKAPRAPPGADLRPRTRVRPGR